MAQTPQELKKLLEDPVTWTRLLDTAETQWIAAILARFVTVQEDGGVLFPGTGAIKVHLEVTSIIAGNVQFTREQLLVGLGLMEQEKLITFNQRTARITLLTGYRDLITGFIR